ncbi:hypothetical protein E4U14_003818 [Claviceps sp. LM454 group G7]|nr:hypothetical protein E4U14_003818 [Claviceps sp. LM454 group G7]
MSASAADLHCPSLLRYSKDYDAWKKADSTQRIKIARKLLRKNSHLATEHFQQRLASFFRIVLRSSGTRTIEFAMSFKNAVALPAPVGIRYVYYGVSILFGPAIESKDNPRSLYVKYLERDVEYEATTLFTFLTRHNTNRPQPQRLAARSATGFSVIFLATIRIRSTPRTHILPPKDSTEYITWEDAFHHLQDRDSRQLRFDYIDKIPTLEEDVDEFEAADLGEESKDAYFQELLDAGLGEAVYGNPDDL